MPREQRGKKERRRPNPTQKVPAAVAMAAGQARGPTGSARDRIVLLLTNGMTVEAAEAYCASNLRMDAETARLTVQDARGKITVAADYARDEQVGTAVMRLNDLYAKSIAGRDTRAALQAQRELNRLLALYSPKDDGDGDGDQGGDAGARLALIASYLIPLGLAADTYPVEEHARIAAEILRDRGLHKT
ncbi:MAG TPA: hypothetical protein VMZ50_07575 [Phycisphaerae bacterium]|nr:hypothetical protein [Phycisphaerae bacterium]